ncbi:hypothetical protein [Serratia sp. UGAL515B_01]|uniref:hypothetical protein n=1 Tax=Serratia sp. UGAL515B_01 TaxID=2986763 RepID=UPI002954D51A|nr:hypothetical protein [Serratia sp. UGAL515B_01]WON78282.1 hypothetical protein OK023_06390 [Serratia sp. UGAL515B_01]
MICNQKNLCLGVLLCSVWVLAGCQTNRPKTSLQNKSQVSTVQAPSKQSNVTPPPAAAPADSKTTKIGLCQSELVSLKQINPKAYAVKQAEFNRLVNNASVYGSIRGDVNAGTKDTLDALYKYKTNELCADIEHEVLQGLIQRGESVK